MKKIAIFVATTGGPVQVERITPEHAPQSMVCLRRSSSVLPISGDYDDFVRRGSGVIEREFGPYDYQSFRLDISDSVGAGLSWQLGFFAAHGVAASDVVELAEADEQPDQIFWLTGRVDYDLKVQEVGHMAEKLAASQEHFAAWADSDIPVIVASPSGQNHQDIKSHPGLEKFKIYELTSADELRPEFQLSTAANSVPLQAKSNSFSGKKVVALLALCLVIASAFVVSAADTGPIGELKRNLLAAIGITKPVNQPPPLDKAKLPTPEKKIGFEIFERIPPEGKSCAQVHFSGVKAQTNKIAKNDAGKFPPSALNGLCGLQFVFDLGIQSKYLAAYIEVSSGRYISAGSKPRNLSGRKILSGRHNWSIAVPRRLDDPFVYKIVFLSGPKSVADKVSWLKNQLDWNIAVGELSKVGVKVAVYDHRVEP